MTRNREIVLTFVVVLVGCACAASLSHSLGLKLSDAAAWAQAIGTVAAILATIAMTNRQIDAIRAEKRSDRIDLVLAIGDAFRAMLDSLAPIKTSMEFREPIALASALFLQPPYRDTTVNRFLEMPIERWPGAMLYIRALNLVAARDAFLSSTQTVMSSGYGPSDPDLWDLATARLEELEVAEASFWIAQAALLKS